MRSYAKHKYSTVYFVVINNKSISDFSEPPVKILKSLMPPQNIKKSSLNVDDKFIFLFQRRRSRKNFETISIFVP